jgi:flavin-dependent dehydrogenase
MVAAGTGKNGMMDRRDGAAIESCDVAVIGGGPAGSTAATLLVRHGYKVIVLEKERHPRFHIGESLLPMNLPVFERLGVLEKVRALGVYKPGADFEADNARGYNTYAFSEVVGQSPPHAFQVWRQDFDQMLFEHARGAGVDAREGHEVLRVEQIDARETRLDVRGADDREYRVRARYVVDASGRDTFLSGRRKLKRRNARHQSAAIFGHFRGVARREGGDAGNISIYSFAHGWMWLIPLPDGVTSMGAVCRPEYLKQRRGSAADFLLATLRANPALAGRMERAELIDGRAHATGNYAYDSERMGGPGWVMVGDAFAFLDPVFSSGVYLAMSGAEQAAAMVDRALREPRRERQLLRALEKRQRKGMRRFAFFIHRFNGPAMQWLFRNPSRYWKLEQGVTSMLAGDVFDNFAVWWRLQLFRLIYLVCVLRDYRGWLAERRVRLEQAKRRFTGGTLPVDEA